MYKRLVDRLDEIYTSAAIAFIFGMLATLASSEDRTIGAFLSSIFFGIPVGVIAGLYALDLGWSDSVVLIVVASSAILAREIIKAILDNKQIIRRLIKEKFNRN